MTDRKLKVLYIGGYSRCGINHCVGNPDLFKKDKVRLTLDERWRNMTRSDQLTATALTWRLKKRFGY